MKPYPLRKEQLRVLRLLLDGNSYPTAAFTLEYYRPIVALHTLERRGLVEQCGTSPTAFVWRITPEGRAAVQETAVKYVPDVETLAAALQDTARASQPTAPWIQAAYDALPDAPLSTEVAAAAEWVEARACDSPCVGCHDGKCDRLHATTILRALTASVADAQRLREAFKRYGQHDPFCPTSMLLPQAPCSCGAEAALAAAPATGLVVVDAAELARLREGVADAQRLREALEQARPLIRHSTACMNLVGQPCECGVHAFRLVYDTALAATPATGLTVVDAAELARLRVKADPEAEAVAELMALGRDDRSDFGCGFTVSFGPTEQWEWFADGDAIHFADTASELLAAVKAALEGEAPDDN